MFPLGVVRKNCTHVILHHMFHLLSVVHCYQSAYWFFWFHTEKINSKKLKYCCFCKSAMFIMRLPILKVQCNIYKVKIERLFWNVLVLLIYAKVLGYEIPLDMPTCVWFILLKVKRTKFLLSTLIADELHHNI